MGRVRGKGSVGSQPTLDAEGMEDWTVSEYAWIITRDHLAEEFGDKPDIGITGPRDAPADLLGRVARGEGRTFYLYDDDGERYYTGKLLTRDGEMDEEACLAPLAEFGAGWAGCTLVKWHGHPEWDCG